MKYWRNILAVGLGLSCVVAMMLVCSCDSLHQPMAAPLEITGATNVGNKVCIDCHGTIAHQFPGNVHARVALADFKLPGGTSCESCHGPASLHVAAGGGRGKFIINPGREPAACIRCHLDRNADFHMPQHHPVLEGRMNCVQCHDPHGSDVMRPKGGLAMARVSESCAECHKEQTRPFVFEHEALREGCTVCHNPHGSPNRKMLIEPDANLCLKCHAQVQGAGVAQGQIYIGKINHTFNLRQGTCWTAGCHSAIHGSNVDPRMRF